MSDLVVPHLAEGVVLNGCGALVDMQLWPGTASIAPKPWLDNFRRHEQVFARNLLSHFLYFSEPLVERLFAQSFLNLSRELREVGAPYPLVLEKWRSFCDDLVITLVQGEEPNPTDSGFLFARKARQVLGVPEERVVTPEVALQKAMSGQTNNIVFVDDFVGSGNQFVTTWNRAFGTGKTRHSFKSVMAGAQGRRVFYCNAISTERGVSRIKTQCPGVVISTAHTLPEAYNWLSPSSALWAAPLLSDGPEIIRQASLRAGIPDRIGAVDDWRGYQELGLGLAFQHSVPDATLPLFYWEQNGWHPLVRRR